VASIKKRPSGKWRARYRDPDNIEHARHFDRKADAQAWLDEVTADLITGRYVDPRAGTRRFGPYASDWLEAQTFGLSSRETVENRLDNHVLPAFERRQIRNIRPSTVQAWLGGQARKYAPSTVIGQLVTLSAVLDAAVDDKLIAANPCKASTVKPPAIARGRIVPWTTELVTAIVDAQPERYQAVTLAGAGLGARQGEVFGLALGDVDWLRKVVHITRQVKIVRNALVFGPPKGDKTRDIPLPDTVSLAFAAHLERYPAVPVTLPWQQPDGDPVTAELLFTTEGRGALRRQTFNGAAWHPALVAAGLQPSRKTGFHQLRHHYASVLLDAGVSIRQLADHLGHADPGFTLRTYTHLVPDSEDRSRRAVDAAFARRHGADRVRTGGSH
jgi:integrase